MPTCSISHVKCPATVQVQMDLYSNHLIEVLDCKNDQDGVGSTVVFAIQQTIDNLPESKYRSKHASRYERPRCGGKVSILDTLKEVIK